MLLWPSFEGINTTVPEKYKEEVWLHQKTSFVRQNSCVTSMRRAQAAKPLCERISHKPFRLADESLLIFTSQKDTAWFLKLQDDMPAAGKSGGCDKAGGIWALDDAPQESNSTLQLGQGEF